MFNTINNNIITTLGINTLTPEKQKEAMERLGALVYQEIMLRALDIMTDDDKDAFEKLLDTNPDPEAIFSFLATKVPNLGEIATEEAQNLREESAEIMSEIGK